VDNNNSVASSQDLLWSPGVALYNTEAVPTCFHPVGKGRMCLSLKWCRGGQGPGSKRSLFSWLEELWSLVVLPLLCLIGIELTEAHIFSRRDAEEDMRGDRASR
jgi:hypothetical protein